jgi:hypothetical protein
MPLAPGFSWFLSESALGLRKNATPPGDKKTQVSPELGLNIDEREKINTGKSNLFLR